LIKAVTAATGSHPTEANSWRFRLLLAFFSHNFP